METIENDEDFNECVNKLVIISKEKEKLRTLREKIHLTVIKEAFEILRYHGVQVEATEIVGKKKFDEVFRMLGESLKQSA